MSAVKTALACMCVATVAGVAMGHGVDRERLVALLSGNAFRASTAPAPSSGQAVDAGPGIARPVSAATALTGNTVILDPDRYGQFHADFEVEGRRIPAIVDTGAGWVSLSYETARDLGYNPAPADFRLVMSTANGKTRAAAIEIPEIRLGPIVARGVKAVVMQPGTLTSGALLGMSFLRELSGFQIDDGRLVLRQ